MSDPNHGLKLDRRLLRRRGWIDPQDLERELEALPDVADKIQPTDQGEETASPAGSDVPSGS